MMKFHLREMIERRGLTQYRLAQLCGVKYQQINRLAQADADPPMTLATLNKLCGALNCQPNDLLTFVPDHLNTP